MAAGAAERMGDLTGRDGSWSADGKQLAFAKGSVLYISGANGSDAHPLYTASGSVFAIQDFSPDGTRIRFTVSDTELNTTALWEVGRDGSHAMRCWPIGRTRRGLLRNWTADGHYYIFQASQTMPNTTSVVTACGVVRFRCGSGSSDGWTDVVRERLSGGR